MKKAENHRRFHSISQKVIYTLTIATIIPMLFFCIYFLISMRKSSKEYYLEQIEYIWQNAANNIDNSLTNSINIANRGVYYNSSLQRLLYAKDPLTFRYSESANSSEIFAYMNSIYSLTPDAVLIHLSTYRTEKSFLLLTSNLQRYLKDQLVQPSMLTPPVSAFRAYVLAPHLQNTYGHQWTHISSFEQEKQLAQGGSKNMVFTLCLPIYHLPQTKEPIAELQINISMDFFKKYCKLLYQPEEDFFIVDSDSKIMFASDASLIGTKFSSPWILDLVKHAKDSDTLFFHELSDKNLRICQQIHGTFYDWYMLKSVPEKVLYQHSHTQLAALMTAFVICLAVAMIINSRSMLNLIQPLKETTHFLNAINTRHSLDEKLSSYVTYEDNDEIGILLNSLENMVNTINHFVIQQYELDILNRTTELKMLQAQINPHFIYNTLQCLATKSLEHNDPKQYDYISSFGQLLQYAMDTQNPLVTVDDELSHIERYIKLQKMRFTSEVFIEQNVSDQIRTLAVPKMILQPLIENSIKHGNLFCQEFGLVIIHACFASNDMLHLDITDNGCSPNQDRIDAVNQQFFHLKEDYSHQLLHHNHTSINQVFEMASSIPSIKIMMQNLFTTQSIGMTNVYLRLLLYFGERCHMELSANDLGGTTIHMEIDYKNLVTP